MTTSESRQNGDSSSSESDGQPEDLVQPYIYEELNAPRATRLILLQPGGRKDEIVCKIVEVDLDPQYTEDVRRVEKNLRDRGKLSQSNTGTGERRTRFPTSISIPNGGPGHKNMEIAGQSEAEPDTVPGLGERNIPSEYEALSWSWGTLLWDAEIKVDKNGIRHYFKVPKSLIGAFRALRKKRVERVIWVDAISIDQKNNQEKSQQVPMMSEIYGGAKSVCVWLGEGDADSKMAFEFIQNEVIKLEEFDKLCENPGSAPKWAAMFNLMKRPWFSRRWIVQEIALAREARLYCGRKHIPWQDFADAVQLFVSVESATHRLSEVMKIHDSFYHVPRWFEYVSKLGASLLVDATGTLFRYSKIESPNAHDGAGREQSPKGLLGRSNRQALLSLEHLVSTLSVFQASNPRDIVYALLAVAKDTNPVPCGRPSHLSDALKSITSGMKLQARPYEVDYTKKYVDICADFVQFAIDQQPDRTRALDIICRPWAPEPKKPERIRNQVDKMTPINPNTGDPEDVDLIETMPSWIPQLYRASHNMIRHADSVEKMGRINADPLVGLPELNQRNYKAAGDKSADLTRVRLKRRSRYHSIDVLGFVLDKVAFVEKQSQNGNIPQTWFNLAQVEIQSFGLKDKTQQTQDHWDEFWRTLVADRGQSGRNPPAYYARAFEMSLKKGPLATGSLNTTDMIDHGRCSVVSEFFRRVQAVIWNRSLIKTEKGRLGIVNEGVETGDLVCILDGCSVPVILRPMKKDRTEIDDDLKDESKDLERLSKIAQKRHRTRRQPRVPLRDIVEKERAKIESNKKTQGREGQLEVSQIEEVYPRLELGEHTGSGAQEQPLFTMDHPANTETKDDTTRSEYQIRSKLSYKGHKHKTFSSEEQVLARQDSQATLAGNDNREIEIGIGSRGTLPSVPKWERKRVWKEYYCQLMGEAFVYGVMDGEAIALYNRDMTQRGESAQDEIEQEEGEAIDGKQSQHKGLEFVQETDGLKVFVPNGSKDDQFPFFRNQVFELR